MTESHNTDCQECGVIYRQLYEAFRSDYGEIRERARRAWIESGLELSEFHRSYLSSAIDTLQLHDANDTMQRQFPRSAEARRKAADHEMKTGHSVMMNGWRTSGIGGDLASWFR